MAYDQGVTVWWYANCSLFRRQRRILTRDRCKLFLKKHCCADNSGIWHVKVSLISCLDSQCNLIFGPLFHVFSLKYDLTLMLSLALGSVTLLVL
jgi:hypothetical protein